MEEHAEPTVSVVVPTHNGERFVAETLHSVLSQSQPRVELIVVDDGSTDRTLEAVGSVAPNAMVFRQRNAGVSSARNRGLALARGRYVVFLDQDDVWHPAQLCRQVAWLEAHPEDGVAVCKYLHWRPHDDGYPDPAGLWESDPGLSVDPDFTGYVYHQFLLDCWALTSGTLLRLDVVRAAGGFDVSLPFSEDWDLWLRLSLTTRFACLAWPPVLYRHHPVQNSRVPRRQDFRVELLLRYASRYGLSSPDGRSVSREVFAATVAAYRASFGYSHLVGGHRWTGVRSLLSAWTGSPRQVKWLAQGIAAMLGWSPTQ